LHVSSLFFSLFFTSGVDFILICVVLTFLGWRTSWSYYRFQIV
jgi:hypothetical protein